MDQCWTVLANSNLGLTVDRYHTKEEPFQTASKVVKIVRIELHCVASVLLVGHIIGQFSLYMSVA